jgi:ATP-binding cassette, subfamily B, bacterial MsbA
VVREDVLRPNLSKRHDPHVRMMTNVLRHFFLRQKEQSLLYRLLAENVPAHRKKYIVAIAAMIVMAIMTASLAYIMGQMVDVMSDPNRKTEVYLIAGIVLFVFVTKGVASFVQLTFLARAGNSIVAGKQIQLFDHIVKQSADYFGSTNSSEIVLRVTHSAQMARSVIDTVVTGFVRDMLTLVALVAVMFYQQPILSLVTFIIGPVIFLVLRKVLSKVKAIMQQEMAGVTEIIKVVQETSIGMRVIKAFALEPHLHARMAAAARTVEKRANKIKALEASTDPLTDTVAGLAISGVIILGTVGLFGGSAGTPGQLISFVTAFLMSYEPAKRLSRMRVTLEAGMVGVRMMYELLDRPITLVEPAQPKAPPIAPIEISFHGVTFGYNAETPTIKSLSHVFRAGQITALVGPSGGGKSTILNLLLRLHDPDAGHICFNGIDLRDLKFSDLRALTAFVGQETFLFDISIKENIRIVAEHATDDDIMAAAKASNAHEFIEKFENGYDTLIGENGRNLSGGQRQRLSIARAILKNAPILLLDEATSALDTHSERHVQQAIELRTKGTTTVVVAHRLSTILQAEQICYVEGGQIVESGTLTELLSQNGKFMALYNSQFNIGSD